MTQTERHRARTHLAAVADASAGLFGIQIVWGVQNVTTSRILQTLGAGIGDLPILWIAAPITGLLVQPVIGWMSDRTRTRYGRRRPYLAAGAVATVIAMLAMAGAATLTQAVAALWLLTASANVAMQPLRALVADIAPPEERARGYMLQVVFIGTGAVFASCLPALASRLLPVSQAAAIGPGLPLTMRYVFWVGAAALIVSVGWTLLRTGEGTSLPPPGARDDDGESRQASYRAALCWVLAGIVIALAARPLDLRREINLLAALALAWGLCRLLLAWRRRNDRPVAGALQIVADIDAMPPVLRRIAGVQFFTWFAFFALWVYAVPVMAASAGVSAPGSSAYAAIANDVGVRFALIDAAAVAAAILLLPRMMARLGAGLAHATCLAIGAAGLLAFSRPQTGWAWLPLMAIGIGWASVLSAPYAIVANAVPQRKLGIYLGIQNIFVVLPQLVAASLLGVIVDRLLGGRVGPMLTVAAASLMIAAVLSALLLPRKAASAALVKICNFLHKLGGRT